MSEGRWPVPTSWAWESIETVAAVVGGGTPPASDPANFDPKGIPWITPSDLTNYEGSHIWRGARSLSTAGFSRCGAQMMPAGSVLLSSRAPIGYCAVAANDLCTNQGFKSLVLQEGIDPLFVRHYLRGSTDYLEENASGTTFKELSGSRVASLSVPLAPFQEQRRIVAKIDSLSAKSKRARDRLNHVPRLVAKYKEALLAAAFRGEMTQSWRNANGSASSDWAGIRASKVRRGVPLAASPSAFVENWRHPGCWRKAHVGEFLIEGGLVDLKDGNHGTNHPKRDEFGHRGLPFITAAQLEGNQLDADNAPRLTGAPLEKLSVGFAEPGDVLLSHKGTVGRAALCDQACVLSPQTTYYRIANGWMLPEFLRLQFLSPFFVRQLDEVKSQTTRDFVPISTQYELFLLRPPWGEQDAIARMLKASFAMIDRLAAEATSARKLIERLDQAVLAQAFRGELVPQDPADEPARLLLERIRAGMTKMGAPRVGRGRPRKLAHV